MKQLFDLKDMVLYGEEEIVKDSVDVCTERDFQIRELANELYENEMETLFYSQDDSWAQKHAKIVQMQHLNCVALYYSEEHCNKFCTDIRILATELEDIVEEREEEE